MAERIIGKIGDPALRKVCKPVTEINSNILSLLDDMTETLDAESNGAALAAPQVGILRRMVVINTGQGFIELINPTIIDKSGEQIGPEACLSMPGIWGKVKRAKNVKVKAMNRQGLEFLMEGKDFMARCLQHEIDHLEGILFIDHVIPGQLFKEGTNEPLDLYALMKLSKQ
ncbi:peptide deformylase [Desulforamulus aquiferis]|uniref:Peptide deformylase n=1 Tax=Desulforamulus aquiferis TaxID=1397668 RepID=A0AAW7ZE96_9FIRM|nr:peptide deformylase [Desulforamulus aquiferis]MDO7787631.1 peptide deformylase [Desulforamulus aquiferis]